MEIGVPGAKYGMTGQLGQAATGGVTLFGGHSGVGMLMAVEISKEKKPAFLTTVSKRGRPTAPGPAKAFVEAMSCETVHYMAACDENDAKAVECLMDWAPPAPREALAAQAVLPPGPGEEIMRIQAELHEMSPAAMQKAVKTLEEMRLDLLKSKKETKTRLTGRRAPEAERPLLHQSLMELEERETLILELLADLAGKVNAALAQLPGGDE